MHRSALIPLLGFGGNNKIIAYATPNAQDLSRTNDVTINWRLGDIPLSTKRGDYAPAQALMEHDVADLKVVKISMSRHQCDNTVATT
jgi:hypothetical protein